MLQCLFRNIIGAEHMVAGSLPPVPDPTVGEGRSSTVALNRGSPNFRTNHTSGVIHSSGGGTMEFIVKSDENIGKTWSDHVT